MSAGHGEKGVGAPDRDLLSLLRLAAPLVLTRAGLASMTIVDYLMVAHADARQLALMTLAEGTFGRLADVSAAFIVSALPLLASLQSASARGQRHAIWQRSMAAAVALGLIGLVASSGGRVALAALGESPDLTEGAAAVIGMLGLGLPATLVAMASAIFLEATGRPGLVAAWIVAANVMNLGLDAALIGGRAGFPALGAFGAAAATSLVSAVLAVALVVAVRLQEGPAIFRRQAGRATKAREQWHLGASVAGTSGLMHAFGIWLTVLAGWLGPRSLAAFASGWVINMPGMLLAMGLGDAVAIRAAADRAGGAPQSWHHLRRDLAVIALLLCPFALVLGVAPAAVAALYTSDQALGEMMRGLLGLSGIVLVLDGVCYGAAAALRGRGDVAGPAVIQGGCMAATPILAGALAFGLQMGVLGMVRAVVATSAIRLVLLMARLVRLTGPRPMPAGDAAPRGL